jgi:hypothetical protein
LWGLSLPFGFRTSAPLPGRAGEAQIDYMVQLKPPSYRGIMPLTAKSSCVLTSRCEWLRLEMIRFFALPKGDLKICHCAISLPCGMVLLLCHYIEGQTGCCHYLTMNANRY